MLFEDYIVYKLTGQAVTDCSIATRTNAFDLDKLRFDPEILSYAGISPDQMPAPLPTGAVAGAVTPALAARLGLPPGVRVVLCGHDCIPENLCSGVVAGGVASMGSGTAEGIGAIEAHDKVDRDAALGANLGIEPYPVPGHMLLFGFNANSGSVVKWYRDMFGAPLHMDYKALDAGMPPEPTGIIAVPHFSGSSTPDFDSRATGTVTGLRFSHTGAHLYKALLEGTAYEMRYIMERMRSAGVAIGEIRISGGGVRSAQWVKIKADILGVPVMPLDNTDTTLGGCAMLAGVAVGEYVSVQDAAQVFVKTGAPVAPDPIQAARYDECYALYKRTRQAARALWAGEEEGIWLQP